jgi:hypothetical protein
VGVGDGAPCAWHELTGSPTLPCPALASASVAAASKACDCDSGAGAGSGDMKAIGFSDGAWRPGAKSAS